MWTYGSWLGRIARFGTFAFVNGDFARWLVPAANSMAVDGISAFSDVENDFYLLSDYVGIDGVDGVCRNHVSYQQNVEKALVRIKKCKTKTRPEKVGFLNAFKKAEACPLYRGRCQSAFLSVLMHLAQT